MAQINQQRYLTCFPPLTQGEKLMVLTFKHKKNHNLSSEDVAAGLGISVNYAANVYHKEKITMKLIRKASVYFGVSEEVFSNDKLFDEVMARLDDVDSAQKQYAERCEAEKKELREQIILLQADLIKIRREYGVPETKSNN